MIEEGEQVGDQSGSSLICTKKHLQEEEGDGEKNGLSQCQGWETVWEGGGKERKNERRRKQRSKKEGIAMDNAERV